MPTFEIGEQDFLLDGTPLQILSGSLHYFRVHRDQWADRIHKAKLLGLNTIETYVAWNHHSPVRGRFDLSGGRDLGLFLDLVAAAGMRALVRPGPYICAEWDNGGLPAWLFQDPEVGIRRHEPRYLAAVGEYFDQLLPVLAPRQVTRGGPVLAVQIENEYGAYGSDKTYLRELVAMTRARGIEVPLFTCDQATDEMLENGGLPELHAMATFGSRSAERLATLRRHQPTGPLMCVEFWNGWFDSWGGHHHTTPAETNTRDLAELLDAGASVNLYMFHGGTNLGLTNGANDKGTYWPITTSYDYDAPLAEHGEPTDKYFAVRDVLARHTHVPDELPAAPGPAPAFEVPLDSRASFWDVVDDLGSWHDADRLPTMDELGHFSGFGLYRARVAADDAAVDFAEVRDRAQAFLDRAPVGVLSRSQHDRTLTLPAGSEGVLELLVEDQGRVNYGARLGEPKGLIGPARTATREIADWQVLPIKLGHVEKLHAALDAADAAAGASPRGNVVPGPTLLRGHFDLGEPTDLFLGTAGWGKGVVWINGFLLGRFWSAGPTRTMYVPAPVLRADRNEILVLELLGTTTPEARFVPGPDLGPEEF